jgi:hypothetical protein
MVEDSGETVRKLSERFAMPRRAGATDIAPFYITSGGLAVCGYGYPPDGWDRETWLKQYHHSRALALKDMQKVVETSSSSWTARLRSSTGQKPTRSK